VDKGIAVQAPSSFGMLQQVMKNMPRGKKETFQYHEGGLWVKMETEATVPELSCLNQKQGRT